MKTFTLGFIFDTSGEKVLLVHKQKPEWQVGRINGIGGKIEEGETPVACIARETKEEACLDIPESEWIFLGTIQTDEWIMHTFMATYGGPLDDAQKGDYEEVEWFAVNALPKECIGNLKWLIPFGLETLEGIQTGTFEVHYTHDSLSK